MSLPDLRLWIGRHVLAERNAIYFPGIVLEVSNPSQCVMVEIKNFHGLVTMYHDVFNRGDLSILDDKCPSYGDIKVGLRVAIKSWSFELHQIYYTPGFVCAILDDCGRFLVRNCHDVERIVGIDELRIILPFWWEYAYYNYMRNISKMDSVQHQIQPAITQMQSKVQPPQPMTQFPSQSSLPQELPPLQSLQALKPPLYQSYMPQEPLPSRTPLPRQPIPPPTPTPVPREPPPYKPPMHQQPLPPQPPLPQKLPQYQPSLPREQTPPQFPQLQPQPQHEPVLAPYHVAFGKTFYPSSWEKMIPHLPPPEYSKAFEPKNQHVTNPPVSERENFNYESNFRKILPKPSDNNYPPKEVDYKCTKLLKALQGEVANKKIKVEEDGSFNPQAFETYSVKAKTVQVPALSELPEIPTDNKTQEAPIVNNAPKVPIFKKIPEIPTENKTPQVPTVNNTPQVPIIDKMPKFRLVAKAPELPAPVKAPEIPIPIVAKEPEVPEKVKAVEIPTTVGVITVQCSAPPKPQETEPPKKKRKYVKKIKEIKVNADLKTLRRPMNAFFYYCQENRISLLGQNDQLKLSNRDISKVLAEKWYKLLPAEKVKYFRLAEKAKEECAKNDPERISWKRNRNKDRIQQEISQLNAKAFSSDDEPRLVIDESRMNEESDDNSSPLFVPKSSNLSELEKVLRNKQAPPDGENPNHNNNNNNKENILETWGKVPAPISLPAVSNNVSNSGFEISESWKKGIIAEYCKVTNQFFNGGTVEQKTETNPAKKKTLIGEKFFPPDFSIEAVQKTGTNQLSSTFTEALNKEILISDAYKNSSNIANKKRLVVLNLFKENGYYPPDSCIEEAMQKHADLFVRKNKLKTKIREVRQKLFAKLKNGTVPLSPLLKDLIGSIIPDGESPLTTPGSD